MSTIALLINLGALAVYGYSARHMNSLTTNKGMQAIVPPELNVYGQLKFLTYQCLWIQILSTTLHILAHFIRPLKGLRDLVFTTLAFPVGSLVVSTFWVVWIFMGRELILPSKMDPFYPPWLNHSTHSIILPINMIMSILLHHKYTRNAFFVTLLYTGLYTAFLHVIKAQTGVFVYGYLNQFSETERAIYFAFTGLIAYLMYKLGQLLTYAVHGRTGAKQVASGRQQQQQQQQPKKQKQK